MMFTLLIMVSLGVKLVMIQEMLSDEAISWLTSPYYWCVLKFSVRAHQEISRSTLPSKYGPLTIAVMQKLLASKW